VVGFRAIADLEALDLGPARFLPLLAPALRLLVTVLSVVQDAADWRSLRSRRKGS
jgi:hypothetical protein